MVLPRTVCGTEYFVLIAAPGTGFFPCDDDATPTATRIGYGIWYERIECQDHIDQFVAGFHIRRAWCWRFWVKYGPLAELERHHVTGCI